jgi:hypothetical protein
MNRNRLFLDSPVQKAAEFRRRFAMARPFPPRGHAVARRAKVVSGVAGEFHMQKGSRSIANQTLKHMKIHVERA